MSEPTTLLDALCDALRGAAQYNQDDQASPVAILWTDKERQWTALLQELRQRLPLLTLGEYSAADRCGPAPYLRCMLGRTLPEDRLPDDAIPVIYLPGVSRQDLRAIDECPRWLQPLAELQYRGVLWSQKNGRDWTISAFLQSADGGLGIQVAADNATREALLRSLCVLAREPLAHLRKEAPLRAPFLDGLLNPDEVRRLLLWMSDPQGYRTGAGQAEWSAFCNLCQHKYGFSPQADGEIVAAERLGQPKGAWEAVWQRFVEAPDAYPNLPDLLRRARPAGHAVQLALFQKASPYWPQDNQSAEDDLRQALLALKDVLPAQARTTIAELEARHGTRRTWVWARLNQAPLAAALSHLSKLARLTEKTVAGPSVQAMADAYAATGWQADAAALEALAAVTSADDVAAVKAAIVPLYRTWLEQSAMAFQGAVLSDPAKHYIPKALPAGVNQAGACILFSDALRLDAAQRLVDALETKGFECRVSWTLAALPTVTPTAKPAISPVAGQFTGAVPGLPRTQGAGLTPVARLAGTPVSATVLRKALEEAGYTVLAGENCGDPAGRGWAESGAIDQYGHGHGWKIAVHLRSELDGLADRISGLLDAGWKRVFVITDHGWLMLPGGLPKVELPQHLTALRKGRCAVMKSGAQTNLASVPWRWDPAVAVAVAPGIACFEAGAEYEHGGLSVQECVVPIIEVTAAGSKNAPSVTIGQVTWQGLRCQVQLVGAGQGLMVDIRTKAADPGTSIVERIKEADPGGNVSLLVYDDDRVGEAAIVVATSDAGVLCAQALTTVGG